MDGTTAILVCALNLLGRSERSFPPIHVIATAPSDGSPNAEAFVHVDSREIYIVASATAFREARCSNRRSLTKLASILAHEEWHVRHGPDERGAYEAQLMTLRLLGMGPDTMMYRSVRLSMEAVLKRPPSIARGAASDQIIADASLDRRID